MATAARAKPACRRVATFTALSMPNQLLQLTALSLFAFLAFTWIQAGEWYQTILAVGVLLELGQEWLHKRRHREANAVRYIAASDSFILLARRFLRWQRLATYPAANYTGLYCCKSTRHGTEIWLTGKDGVDALLIRVHYTLRDNNAAARRFARAISKASGLPFLY